jgi:hypothetical protein
VAAVVAGRRAGLAELDGAKQQGRATRMPRSQAAAERAPARRSPASTWSPATRPGRRHGGAGNVDRRPSRREPGAQSPRPDRELFLEDLDAGAPVMPATTSPPRATRLDDHDHRGRAAAAAIIR